jgi:exoribonuclease R
MLPTILSDCLCSLQENVTRVAFVMDVILNKDEIIDIKFSNCFIKVVKNYCYEEPKLLADKFYNEILDVTQHLQLKNKYTANVRNSHDVVSYLMILMNFHCAKKLLESRTGIFRSTIMKREITVPDFVPEEVTKYIKIWNSASGQYVDGSELVDTRHELLDMDAYIHITSPIRRLVDLLNMIRFQNISGSILLSENSKKFYDKWLTDIEYINITMRSIRKIQCDCSLLDLCYNNQELLEKEYDGYLFDKISRNDGLYQFVVYLPELKMTSRITMRDNFENFECQKFKLFIFNDEEHFKRKIRLHLL